MAVWMAVALAPVALFALRLIDDSAVALLVPPALALMIVLFLVVMGAAVRAAAGASLPRALAGAGGALLAVVLLTLPMSHVIGQRACPERMGVDRGVQVSSQMLDAWRNGAESKSTCSRSRPRHRPSALRASWPPSSTRPRSSH